MRIKRAKSEKITTKLVEMMAAKILMVHFFRDEPDSINFAGMTKERIFFAFSLQGFDPGQSSFIRRS